MTHTHTQGGGVVCVCVKGDIYIISVTEVREELRIGLARLSTGFVFGYTARTYRCWVIIHRVTIHIHKPAKDRKSLCHRNSLIIFPCLLG